MRFGNLSCVGCTLGAAPSRTLMPSLKEASASVPPASPNDPNPVTRAPINIPADALRQGVRFGTPPVGRQVSIAAEIAPWQPTDPNYVPGQGYIQPQDPTVQADWYPPADPTSPLELANDAVFEVRRNPMVFLLGAAAAMLLFRSGRKVLAVGALGAGAYFYAKSQGIAPEATAFVEDTVDAAKAAIAVQVTPNPTGTPRY